MPYFLTFDLSQNQRYAFVCFHVQQEKLRNKQNYKLKQKGYEN